MVRSHADSVFAQHLPPGMSSEDTVLSQLLGAMTSGSRLLPSDRLLPASVLVTYQCPWEAHVRVFQSHERQGGQMVAVRVTGTHNNKCVAAAKSRRIPVSLSPRLRQWILEAFEARVSFDDIEKLLLIKNCPQATFIAPPPRPAACWEVAQDLARFFPSQAVLRKLQHLVRAGLRLDSEDEASVVKFLTTSPGMCHLPLRKAACACLQVDPRHPVCMNTACVSFRVCFMSAWQREFFNRDHPFSTILIDGTGQVNEYGYILFTAMVINPLTMRGIPISHMVLGRTTSQDVYDWLAFIAGSSTTVKTVKLYFICNAISILSLQVSARGGSPVCLLSTRTSPSSTVSRGGLPLLI